MSIKAGDKVKKLNGNTFSNGRKILTIEKITNNGRTAWLQETGANIEVDALKVVATPKKAVIVPSIGNVIASSQAVKADAGKLQWTLVMNGCAKALLGVVKVMTIAITPKEAGGRGYAKNSWKIVPEAQERYQDALYRHLAKIAAGEVYDNGPDGTGQLHWDCVATNALFLSQFEHEARDGTTINSTTART